MLSLSLTPNAVGINISGDVDDLMEFYDAIYDILGDFEIPESDQSDHAIGLCYDLRKSYEGKRDVEIKTVPVVENSTVHVDKIIYSVNVVLPIFITQLSIVCRYADEFLYRSADSTTLLYSVIQKLVYAIEDRSEVAGRACLNWFNDVPPFSSLYLMDHIELVASTFILQEPNSRFGSLLNIFNDLKENSVSYKKTESLLLSFARMNNCSLQEVGLDETEVIYAKLDTGEVLW